MPVLCKNLASDRLPPNSDVNSGLTADHVWSEQFPKEIIHEQLQLGPWQSFGTKSVSSKKHLNWEKLGGFIALDGHIHMTDNTGTGWSDNIR